MNKLCIRNKWSVFLHWEILLATYQFQQKSCNIAKTVFCHKIVLKDVKGCWSRFKRLQTFMPFLISFKLPLCIYWYGFTQKISIIKLLLLALYLVTTSILVMTTVTACSTKLLAACFEGKKHLKLKEYSKTYLILGILKMYLLSNCRCKIVLF